MGNLHKWNPGEVLLYIVCCVGHCLEEVGFLPCKGRRKKNNATINIFLTSEDFSPGHGIVTEILGMHKVIQRKDHDIM